MLLAQMTGLDGVSSILCTASGYTGFNAQTSISSLVLPLRRLETVVTPNSVPDANKMYVFRVNTLAAFWSDAVRYLGYSDRY